MSKEGDVMSKLKTKHLKFVISIFVLIVIVFSSFTFVKVETYATSTVYTNVNPAFGEAGMFDVPGKIKEAIEGILKDIYNFFASAPLKGLDKALFEDSTVATFIDADTTDTSNPLITNRIQDWYDIFQMAGLMFIPLIAIKVAIMYIGTWVSPDKRGELKNFIKTSIVVVIIFLFAKQAILLLVDLNDALVSFFGSARPEIPPQPELSLATIPEFLVAIIVAVFSWVMTIYISLLLFVRKIIIAFAYMLIPVASITLYTNKFKGVFSKLYSEFLAAIFQQAIYAGVYVILYDAMVFIASLSSSGLTSGKEKAEGMFLGNLFVQRINVSYELNDVSTTGLMYILGPLGWGVLLYMLIKVSEQIESIFSLNSGIADRFKPDNFMKSVAGAGIAGIGLAGVGLKKGAEAIKGGPRTFKDVKDKFKNGIDKIRNAPSKIAEKFLGSPEARAAKKQLKDGKMDYFMRKSGGDEKEAKKMYNDAMRKLKNKKRDKAKDEWNEKSFEEKREALVNSPTGKVAKGILNGFKPILAAAPKVISAAATGAVMLADEGLALSRVATSRGQLNKAYAGLKSDWDTSKLILRKETSPANMQTLDADIMGKLRANNSSRIVVYEDKKGTQYIKNQDTQDWVMRDSSGKNVKVLVDGPTESQRAVLKKDNSSATYFTYSHVDDGGNHIFATDIKSTSAHRNIELTSADQPITATIEASNSSLLSSSIVKQCGELGHSNIKVICTPTSYAVSSFDASTGGETVVLDEGKMNDKIFDEMYNHGAYVEIEKAIQVEGKPHQKLTYELFTQMNSPGLEIGMKIEEGKVNALGQFQVADESTFYDLQRGIENAKTQVLEKRRDNAGVVYNELTEAVGKALSENETEKANQLVQEIERCREMFNSYQDIIQSRKDYDPMLNNLFNENSKFDLGVADTNPDAKDALKTVREITELQNTLEEMRSQIKEKTKDLAQTAVETSKEVTTNIQDQIKELSDLEEKLQELKTKYYEETVKIKDKKTYGDSVD